MKMVMIVFRDALTEQVMAILRDREVRAYTLFPEVSGVGSTGVATGTFSSAGSNSMVLAALPKEQADEVVGELKAFHDGLADEHPAGKIPLHVFVLPCIQVV